MAENPSGADSLNEFAHESGRLDGRLTSLEEVGRTLTARFAELAQLLEPLPQQLADFERRILKLESRVSTIPSEAEVQRVRTELQANRETMYQLVPYLDSLSKILDRPSRELP